MAVAARALGADAVSLDNTLCTWALTFYPNNVDVARRRSRWLLVTMTGMTNLSIVRATLSGTIVGAIGPVAAGSIRLIPEADADAGMSVLC